MAAVLFRRDTDGEFEPCAPRGFCCTGSEPIPDAKWKVVGGPGSEEDDEVYPAMRGFCCAASEPPVDSNWAKVKIVGGPGSYDAENVYSPSTPRQHQHLRTPQNHKLSPHQHHINYTGQAVGPFAGEEVVPYTGWKMQRPQFAFLLVISLFVGAVALITWMLLYVGLVGKVQRHHTEQGLVPRPAAKSGSLEHRPEQSIMPSSRSAKKMDPNIAPMSLNFDCQLDFDPNCYKCLLKSWSVEKIAWCCTHENLGCPTTTTPSAYMCEGNENLMRGWTEAKKGFCCAHYGKACEASED